MIRSRFFIAALAITVAAMLVIAPWSPPQAQGRSGDQQMARTRFVSDGVQAVSAGVLQTGEVSTLSAVIANTLTKIVTAPSSGQTYLRGIWVESAVTATAAIDVKYGTGTNCATGTTTLISLKGATGVNVAPGYYPIGILVPAAKDTCLVTEAAGTTVRGLTN